MKLREVTFYEDLYQANVSFISGGTADEFINLIKQRHKEAGLYSWGERFEFGEDGNTTDGYQFHINAIHGNGEKFYVWVLEPTPFLVYHEIFHLAGDILNTRGIKYADSSEECYAYLGGWLFEKMCNLMKWKPKYSY